MSEILRYVENKSFKMEIIPDTEEGDFVVSFPDLSGCITCGETMEEALLNAEDAKNAWLEAAKEPDVNVT